MKSTTLNELLARPTITPDQLYRSGILPLSRNSIYELIKTGEIETISLGRKKAIIVSSLKKKLRISPSE